MTTKTLAAVQIGPGSILKVDEVVIPEIGEDKALVKLFSSGVCHSQLHQMENETAARPLVLGHEGTGIVVKVGNRVNHLKEGDHAIVTWVQRHTERGPMTPSSSGVSYRGEPVNGNVNSAHVRPRESVTVFGVGGELGYVQYRWQLSSRHTL